MHAWLTRQRDGNYMLTSLQPFVESLRGSAGVRDAYVRPGDVLGVRHLCPQIVRLVFHLPADLAPLESVRVWLDGGTT